MDRGPIEASPRRSRMTTRWRRRWASPRRRSRDIRVVVYAITLVVVALIANLVDWARVQREFFDLELIGEQFPDILTQAARNTLIFTAFGFSGGLVLGLVVALMRLSSIRPYRWFATGFIEIFRGLPALLTILIIGFALPIALGVRVPGTYGAGSMALAIVAGAYMAETIRAGIEAVPRGQMEAARSLGMSYSRAMVSVVIPQAFRIIIPPMTNELVLLLKDTSLISVLGVTARTKELTRFGRDGVISNANATPLIVAGFVYLLLTIPLTRLAALLERRGRRAR
jgi:polar amino acid transport system permease protein